MFQEEYDKDYLKKQFTAALMRAGKKATAENILNGALLLLRKKGYNPMIIFLKALHRSAPLVGVVGKKRGRTKIMIPRPLEDKKRLGFALKWIVSGARMRTDYTMVERLARELLSLSRGRGNAIRKKIALHKIVSKSKNNTYMRW